MTTQQTTQSQIMEAMFSMMLIILLGKFILRVTSEHGKHLNPAEREPVTPEVSESATPVTKIPLPKVLGRNIISGSTFNEMIHFVERKLGVFQEKPKLVPLGREEETLPDDIGAEVVGISPEVKEILYAKNIVPESVEVQRTLLLHEISELRFGELDPKGVEDIHRQAQQFVKQYHKEARAASSEAADAALRERGYYWAFQPTELIMPVTLEVTKASIEHPSTGLSQTNSSSVKLYHCTDMSNVDSIMKDGLLSSGSEFIFFFPNIQVAEEAGISGMAILEVSITDDEVDKCIIGETFPELYTERFGGEPPADTTLREYIRSPIAYGIPEVCCTTDRIPADRIKHVKTIRR